MRQFYLSAIICEGRSGRVEKGRGMTASHGQQMALPDAILTGNPYPTKAMITAGGNLAAVWPDSPKVKKAFGSLDMIVIIDLFMT